MVDNGKNKNTHVTDSKIGVIGDQVTIHGGIYFYQSSKDKDGTADYEKDESIEKQVAFDPSEAANILHLSDLHFGADKQSDPLSDASRWCGQLIEDLCNKLGCEHLDAVIISGDIGNLSEPREYQAAEVFLEKLCKKFSLESSQLIIVPGNHDLSWEVSEESYQLVRRKHLKKELKIGFFYEESKDVIGLRGDDAYPIRFQNFSLFYENISGVSYSLDPKIQATFHHLPDLNLLVVGFNSSWETDHHFKTRISINPDAVEFALSRIREQPDYKDCIKLAVWHHPLVSEGEDRIKDHGFLERLALAKFQVCLHGHIHKDNEDKFIFYKSHEGYRIHAVGAGTFGAPVSKWTPGYPLQYNLLRFSKNILRIEIRCRKKPNGAWGHDHHYDIDLSGSAQPEKQIKTIQNKPYTTSIPSKSNAELEAQIQAYCKKAKSLHEKLPLLGFKTKLRVPILIKDIYIPLRVMVDRRVTGEACFADADDAEKCLREYGCEEISVPEAFSVAERLGRRGIVILGDPGSGKTTHLKRLFLWCLEGGFKKLGLPSDMIPVFLPLRELRNLKANLDEFIQEQLNQPHLDTPEGFGKTLLDRGNLLFLLDGLDEISDTQERVKVSKWINAALSIHKTCLFVVTCRFAGYTPKARLSEDFLEMHMRPLTTDQAEEFILNWYRLVESGLSTDPVQALIDAEKNAENLIKRLKQKEYRSARVFTMTRNPLLLTNLCLVHRDRGGQLPTRRSRLYEESIQVLLELWKESIGLKSKVDAETGSQVLQPAAFWLHKKEGRIRATADELAPVIEPALKKAGWSHGSARDFMKIVRDESGLLTGWSDDQYGFMHLGFQEYLAALEIQNLAYRDSNMLKQLAMDFSNSWWQEVILLLLAQKNPCLFKEFMTEVVKQDSFITDSNLIDLCLEESAETTVQPFLELLKIKPGTNRKLWERQFLGLQAAERLDAKALEAIMDQFRDHPYEPIRQWILERYKQSQQDIIRPEASGYELVLIKGGTFMMGLEEYNEEKPVHEVTVHDFYMGRYPVTNEKYGRFIEATGYQEPKYWGDREYNQPRQPVVGVSWYDAKEFARWAGLQLPSEAQWEYACRGGTTTRYYTGDSEDNLDRVAWYSKNSGYKLHPVGEKEPNAFGLYDMHGNVWEWCEDHWHENYNGAPVDGSAWVDQDEGASRVFRGGSWGGSAEYCRSAYRVGGDPGYRFYPCGFRLVRLLGQPG